MVFHQTPATRKLQRQNPRQSLSSAAARSGSVHLNLDHWRRKSPTFSVQTEDSEWLIKGGDARQTYTIRLEGGQLNIYDTGKAYPLIGRALSDGSFAFYGQPETDFPSFSEQTYRLSVEGGAPNYQLKTFDIGNLGGVSNQPELVTRSVPIDSISDMKVYLFTGGGLPRTGITPSLNRKQVRLHGQARVSDDPTTGVDSAVLEIINGPTNPTTTADAEGRFKFPEPLPVALSI